MAWNYWKCIVKKRHAMKRRWLVVCIETEQVVSKCKKWKQAVANAIAFQAKMNKELP